MTLVVAAIEGQSVWMVADTAITGGPMSVREKEFAPKVLVAVDRTWLVGYAGDAHFGAQLADKASRSASPAEALSLLSKASGQHKVEFALAWMEGDQPRLMHIENGSSKPKHTLHLGSHDAFEKFQDVRHNKGNRYAPKALKTFLGAVKGPAVSLGLEDATIAMLELFSSGVPTDVGGWAVPYELNKAGAFFFNYAFAVSDPILDWIAPGSMVAHGTAQAGGYNLSVTELAGGDGMVVYWLQLPGGRVLVRREGGHTSHAFDGRPSEFKDQVLRRLGLSVDLWFSDDHPGPVKSVHILKDANGGPAAAVADHGDAWTLSVVNVGTQFQTGATIRMGDQDSTPVPTRFEVSLSDDASRVTIVDKSTSPVRSIQEVNASELDDLIKQLAWMRSAMALEQPAEPPTHRLQLQIDPAWRTMLRPHPSITGHLLLLRHGGYGWIGFILPDHECRNLGQWLLDHASRPSDGETKS